MHPPTDLCLAIARSSAPTSQMKTCSEVCNPLLARSMDVRRILFALKCATLCWHVHQCTLNRCTQDLVHFKNVQPSVGTFINVRRILYAQRARRLLASNYAGRGQLNQQEGGAALHKSKDV